MKDDSSKKEKRKIISLILWSISRDLISMECHEAIKNLTQWSEIFLCQYGRQSTKGYISISIYHKMRKRQYGNRWMTQFVPLCREEVRRLEESGKTIQSHTESN